MMGCFCVFGGKPKGTAIQCQCSYPSCRAWLSLLWADCLNAKVKGFCHTSWELSSSFQLDLRGKLTSLLLEVDFTAGISPQSSLAFSSMFIISLVTSIYWVLTCAGAVLTPLHWSFNSPSNPKIRCHFTHFSEDNLSQRELTHLS